MTADDDTRESGHESNGIEQEMHPMEDAPDATVAGALEDEKQEARHAVDDVVHALVNEDVPLTDEKVARVWDAADGLTALSRTLVHRVPEAHQVEDRREE